MLLGNVKISRARGYGLEFEPVFSFRDHLDGFFNLLQAGWECISGASGQALKAAQKSKNGHAQHWLNLGGLLANGKISWARGYGLEFEPVFAFRDRLDFFF